MSNPILIFESVDGATLTASGGTLAGSALANLQDWRHDTTWQSDATTDDQTLKAAWDTARTIDSVLVANHNLVATGVTDLIVETSEDENVYAEVGRASGAALAADPLYIPCVSGSVGFMRLKWHKGSALAMKPSLGMLFAGARGDVPLYLDKSQRGLDDDTVVDTSLSGRVFASSVCADREGWKIDLGVLRQAHLYAWMRLIRAVGGRLYPWWICDMDGHWHLVRFKKPVDFTGRGGVIFSARGIEIQEERVGITVELPGGYDVI